MIQIEGGYTFARAGDERAHTVGEILIRAPIARRVEVRLKPGSYVSVDGVASELEEPGAGFKVELIQSV